MPGYQDNLARELPIEEPVIDIEVKRGSNEEKALDILKVHKHFLQAYKIRTYYIMKNAEIIHDLARFMEQGLAEIKAGGLGTREKKFRSFISQDLLARLRIYYNREKKLIDIVGRSRRETIEAFDINNMSKELRKELGIISQKEIGLSMSDLQIASNIYTQLVNEFFASLGDIQDRLKSEKRFLDTPNPDNAELFILEFKQEMEKQIEIEQEVIRLQPTVQKALVTTAGVGPIINKIIMATTGINSLWQGDLDLDAITIGFIVLIGIIAIINTSALGGLFLSRKYKKKMETLTADMAFLDYALPQFK